MSNECKHNQKLNHIPSDLNDPLSEYFEENDQFKNMKRQTLQKNKTVTKDLPIICSDGKKFDNYETASMYENSIIKDSKIKSLQTELRAVHTAYISGLKLRDSEIEFLNGRNDDLKWNLRTLSRENKEIYHKLSNTCKINSDLVEENKQWIGRTLKFQYLFQQMNKIGLKQSNDIFECFEDIEVPDVSIHIKDQFIPTQQTDNIDYDEDEFINEEEGEEDPDIIGDYNQILSNPENFRLDVGFWRHNSVMNAIILIQKYWRGYFARQMFKNKIKINELESSLNEQLNRIENYKNDTIYNNSSIIIQKYWRGYLGRERYSVISMINEINHRDKSIVIIQKYWRRYTVLKKVKEFHGILYLLNDYILGYIRE